MTVLFDNEHAATGKEGVVMPQRPTGNASDNSTSQPGITLYIRARFGSNRRQLQNTPTDEYTHG
jgi:hypothetical protein